MRIVHEESLAAWATPLIEGNYVPTEAGDHASDYYQADPTRSAIDSDS
jgi:hypothetical protein